MVFSYCRSPRVNKGVTFNSSCVLRPYLRAGFGIKKTVVYAAVFGGSRHWLAGVPTVRTVGYKYGVRFAD